MARFSATSARLGLALVLPALVAGCTPSEPTGQVVARVNGTEITRRELVFEIETDPSLRQLGGVKAQRAALEALVARKLLVAAASRALLDRSPDFIAARRRMADVMLVDQFAGRLAGELPPVSDAQVDRFMAENPHMFARRENLELEQLLVPRDWVADLAGSANPRETAAIILRCRAQSAACQRRHLAVDTQTTTPERARALGDLPTGAALLTAAAAPADGSLVVLETVLSRRRLVADLEADKARARAILGARQIESGRQSVLAHLRRQANIAYQPGFAPDAQATGNPKAR